ncbi:MAG: hypothetical protein RLP12_02895, partial [Ekhidna sp.]
MIDSLKDNKTLSVLDEAECQKWSQQVMDLKHVGIHRQKGLHGFWTLGRASYLDGTSAHGDGISENEVIAQNFGPLLSQVTEVLEKELGRSAYTCRDFALPGFHIYQGNEVFPTGLAYGGSVHLDKPHIQAEFKFEIEDVISFTLPLRLPEKGAGLNYWDAIPDFLVDEVPSMTPLAQKWLGDHAHHHW